MRRVAMLTVTLTLLAACARTGAGTDPAACLPWRPIYVSQQDTLTTETSRAILAHNLTGRSICGW